MKTLFQPHPRGGLIATLGVLALLGVPLHASAQPPIPPTVSEPYPSRFFYGGNVNFQFGNGFAIGGSPYCGWQFTRNFGAGLGIDYRYYTDDPYSSHNLGGRAFATYDIIIPTLYARAEFAYYWYTEYVNGSKIGNSTVPYLFLGGGYRQPVGKNVYLEAEVMFDVLRDPNSAYDNWQPLIRGGVVVGI
jgi:hypothetical protein